jgi:hypothetical protein
MPSGSVECFVYMSAHMSDEAVCSTETLFTPWDWTEPFMQPRYRNSVCPMKMTHGRVAAGLDDLYHRLAILMKDRGKSLWQQYLPPNLMRAKARF